MLTRLLLLACLALLALPGLAKNPIVEVTVEGRGKFQIELFADAAPKTVAHSIDLIKRKFFDGMLVHRLVPDFVVQWGDPKSKKMKPAEAKAKPGPMGGTDGLGDGDSGKSIPFETNSKKHDAGTIGMALSGPRSDTGDSQWFVNLKDNHRLNGDYCVFGKVVGKGMDVVRKIERGDRIASIRVLR